MNIWQTNNNCYISYVDIVLYNILDMRPYQHCKSLHSLPRLTPKTQWIQVGNGQFISVLFIIPVIVHIHSHSFNVYTLVSQIHENVDLVLGI